MGRSKKGKTIKKGAKVEVYGSDDERTYNRESVPDKTSSEYFEDDVDAFHTERDQILLRKSAGLREDSSEEEEEAEALVEDDEKDYYLSDDDLQRLERVVETAKSQKWRDRLKQDMQDFGHDEQEGEEEGDEAWGQRRKYYSTERDEVRFDNEAAELEGEEAQRLMQKQLAEVTEDDFLDLTHLMPKASSTDDPGQQESVKRDLSQLPLSEKVKLLRRESPEIFGLYEEYKTSRAELDQTVEPVLGLVAAAKLPDGPAAKVLMARRQALLLYCCNLAFYFVLKTARTPLLDHPVMARILQLKRCVEGYRAAGDEVDVIARCAQKGRDVSRAPRALRKRKKTTVNPAASDNIKKTRFVEEDEEKEDGKNKGEEPGEEVDLKEEGGDEKRPIDYEMEKNKGLTPKRKKEQRNPRVKHREKFRKAKIRRKGQVREARAPVTAYGGELSGIRAGIIRSTKFKY